MTFATAPTTDTTLRKQTINIPNDTSNYIIAEAPLSNPDNIFMGEKREAAPSCGSTSRRRSPIRPRCSAQRWS